MLPPRLAELSIALSFVQCNQTSNVLWKLALLDSIVEFSLFAAPWSLGKSLDSVALGSCCTVNAFCCGVQVAVCGSRSRAHAQVMLDEGQPDSSVNMQTGPDTKQVVAHADTWC